MEQEKKKVLFVIGMEHNIERLLNKMTNINPENSLILQTYGPVISPFGDVMRDILIAVYQENIEEIFVAAPEDCKKDKGDILNKIIDNKELQEKVQTYDYLFKNCMPEFQANTIREWLAGGKSMSDGVKNSFDVIRHHPLMPSHVKVTELYPKKENLKEMDAS